MSEEEEKMQQALLKLKELVRQVSITRFKQSAQNDNYNLLEVPKSSEKTVFDHWMSLILISGKSLRVTFKTHFNIKTCRKIASPIYGKKPDDIAVRQAQDFVKEYGNLAAGFLKKIFEEQDVEVGISLPLVIRGFDEVFFDKSPDQSKLEDCWRLDNGTTNLVCTSLLEVYQPDIIHELDFNIEEEEEEEIDFL
jgi:CheY-specific phosphatase CheX